MGRCFKVMEEKKQNKKDDLDKLLELMNKLDPNNKVFGEAKKLVKEKKSEIDDTENNKTKR